MPATMTPRGQEGREALWDEAVVGSRGGLTAKGPKTGFHFRLPQLAVWSNGMIFASGAPDPSVAEDDRVVTGHGLAGLFRELSPGSLAPEARIMPLDQTAS